ncbi:methylesterase 10-like [Macadamia integrifolia]|uniref:methylesterase 10-like n=1 Tax=Macadamia integrifolia TaxID=60698 RepID=UPI001C529905|nr:methylesterase 10-like [Macadamia integrifolia]
MADQQKHFVLVHEACHGAWTWYKVVKLLSSAGHRVTALDLGVSRCNEPEDMDKTVSISDYLKPLMEFMGSLPEEERVILVGHGYGGVAVSLAMEKFPEKISVAVFAAAVMPSWKLPIIDVFEESLLDCEFSFHHGRENFPTSVILGLDFLSSKMYNCCPSEDTTLASLLVEPTSFFLKDLGNETLLTREKFGSVNRVYIVCSKDEVLKEEFQLWMIYNSPTTPTKAVVRVILDSGHMVMLSKPDELSICLKEIAEKYTI